VLLGKDGRWRLSQPDELGMRVREARPCGATFVDECVDVAEALFARCPDPVAPGLRDDRGVLRRELGEGAQVVGGMDDHLLALEGRVEVRHDAYAPRVADRERLRRSAVLAACAERARVELLAGRRLDQGRAGAGAASAVGGDDDEAARKGVAAQVYDESPELCCSRNGLIRSIGVGKTIVELFDAPISSSVCR